MASLGSSDSHRGLLGPLEVNGPGGTLRAESPWEAAQRPSLSASQPLSLSASPDANMNDTELTSVTERVPASGIGSIDGEPEVPTFLA